MFGDEDFYNFATRPIEIHLTLNRDESLRPIFRTGDFLPGETVVITGIRSESGHYHRFPMHTVCEVVSQSTLYTYILRKHGSKYTQYVHIECFKLIDPPAHIDKGKIELPII